MSWLYRLNKPEYLFRPSQLMRRLFLTTTQEQVRLPWGSTIKVNPKEDIGRAINTLGLYELPLSECLWRSLNHVQDFIDVGANIGYFSSLAGGHASFKGQIHAFEPHPTLFTDLAENLRFFKNVTLHNVAASDQVGFAELEIPASFDGNMGIASLEKKHNPGSTLIKVKTELLDNLFLAGNRTYAIKIDTEGHEASVLKGAQKLLASGQFRFVFFEEFEDITKAQSGEILRQYGYHIYKISRGFWGPTLVDTSAQSLPLSSTQPQWEPCNYFALKASDELLPEFKKMGWSIL